MIKKPNNHLGMMTFSEPWRDGRRYYPDLFIQPVPDARRKLSSKTPRPAHTTSK